MNLAKLIKKIENKLLWFLDGLLWLIFTHVLHTKQKNNLKFTIGITTFMDRYVNCTKPLVRTIAILFPNCQIIVIANGHVKAKEQMLYLTNITKFCSKFPNVKLLTYIEPKGLSHLWNQLIINAYNDNILILNDDVKIKHRFSVWFNKSIDLKDNKITVINKSWSHFIISKSLIKLIGFFDEGFLEIGGEDDDYAARLELAGIRINHVSTNTIKAALKVNKKMLTTNSYGRNMNTEMYGYSTYNSIYLNNKWQMSNEPFEGAIEVPDRLFKYWKYKYPNDTNNVLNK